MATNHLKDFQAFFTDLYRVEGKYGPRPLLPPFLREFINHAFKNGEPSVHNVLDARSKKEGKSALAGAVALWQAINNPYTESYIIAADKDQAADRVLRAIKFACEKGPLSAHTTVYRDVVELDNQSVIKAIPADWQGAAGGNPVCVIVDELHAWVYPGQRRLFDEMMIPPTQPNGVRWIASYAGYLGESELLKEWWDRGLAGEKISEDLPIYLNNKSGLLAFVDTGPESWRMPWMTEKYINEIRESERDTAFRRLWLNEWITSESAFVPFDRWEACYSPDVRPLFEGDKRVMTLGVDASTTRDITAIIGTWYNPNAKKVDVICVRAFKPKRGLFRMGKPTIDLELVRDEILNLHKRKVIGRVLYDPFQLHSIALELERAGVRMVEFPQTNMRIEADQQLYDAIIGQTVRHYNDPLLNTHIRNAIARDTVRGFRLDKEKTTLKIDAAVALSMSLYGSMKYEVAAGPPQIIPNPFYSELPEGRTYYDSPAGWFEVDISAPSVHPPGVTWKNCRFRNRGCPACIDELAQEGVYEQSNQEAQLFRDAHPELLTPLPNADRTAIERLSYGAQPRNNDQARAVHVIRSIFERNDINL